MDRPLSTPKHNLKKQTLLPSPTRKEVFLLFFCGFKTLTIFSLFEASFSNLHKRKNIRFFPKKIVAMLQKFTPKNND
jgi:hypothetical protein